MRMITNENRPAGNRAATIGASGGASTRPDYTTSNGGILDPDAIRAVEAALSPLIKRTSGDHDYIDCLFPGHDDHDGHMSHNRTNYTFFCHKCDRGGGLYELAGLLGVIITRSGSGAAPRIYYEYANGLRKVRQPTIDEDGEPAKKMWWEHLDDKGQWQKGRDGRDPGMYRQAEAVGGDPSEWIHVFNGEKAADRAVLEGIKRATCFPGGEGSGDKVKPAYLPLFKGRKVVWHQDNDSTGAAFTGEMERKLPQIAAEVKVIDWGEFGVPQGGDAYDAFDLDMTAEQLQKIVDATPAVPKPPAPLAPRRTRWTHADLMLATFPKQEWVVDGLVLRGGFTLLAGKKKRGKSWLALQIAQAVASGGCVLGRAALSGPVLYLALEDGPVRLKARLLKQRAPADLPITYETSFTKLNEGGLAELAELIGELQPVLVIIDTLKAATNARVKEDDAGDMGDLGNMLRIVAQEANIGILVVAHHGKHTYDDPGDDIRGSSALPGATDVNLGLYRTDSGYVLKGEGKDIEDLELRVLFDAADTWTWHLQGDARQLAKAEADNDVLEVLHVLQEADAGAIAREMGKSRPTVIPVLNRLVSIGSVLRREAKTDKKRSTVLYRRAEENQ